MVSSVSNTSASGATASANAALSSATSAQTQSQNFLQLLVAQLNNQDPMNPMDNAQMTSQIAQINTVQGIQQLNTTMTSMATQFSSLQQMQGAAMIGHQVAASGNTLSMSNGTGQGAFNLSSAATAVTVQVKTPGGQLIDTLNLGPLSAGQNAFTWPNTVGYSGTAAPVFSVCANVGSTAVSATPQMVSTVSSVGTDSSGAMNLTLQNGTTIPYSGVQQIY